jgi:hypothetical protein
VKKPEENLRACDVLNWDHLRAIEAPPQQGQRDLNQGFAVFAYDFTSTADEDRRDVMLSEMLKNATNGQSRDTAEKIVKRLAEALKSDHKNLRKFAKQCGVRLKLLG